MKKIMKKIGYYVNFCFLNQPINIIIIMFYMVIAFVQICRLEATRIKQNAVWLYQLIEKNQFFTGIILSIFPFVVTFVIWFCKKIYKYLKEYNNSKPEQYIDEVKKKRLFFPE